MLDLSLESRDGLALIKDISKRQGISRLYLEQLFSQLKTADLVRSVRGPKGGFRLTKLPSQIRVSDILQVMEGSTAPVECVDNAMLCSRANSCVTRKIWVEMKKAMDEVLESTTLQDLVKQEKRDEVGTP